MTTLRAPPSPFMCKQTDCGVMVNPREPLCRPRHDHYCDKVTTSAPLSTRSSYMAAGNGHDCHHRTDKMSSPY